MMKIRHGWVLALAVMCSLAACGGDDEGGGNTTTAGSGGTGGASGESGMGGTGGGSGESGMGGTGGGEDCGGEELAAGECLNIEGEPNLDCPDTVGPYEGTCATKGTCCQRTSNALRIDQLCDDEPMTLEYRVMSSAVINHPMSTSLPFLLMLAEDRARTCDAEQCFLWRFEQPRAGGEPVAGAGKSNIAFGRYNCDGTFSYYGDTAAPVREADGFIDPARWKASEAVTTVDPTKEGAGRNKVAWATNPNQRLSTSPFFMAGEEEIDWELATSGFEILEIDTSDAGRECQGAYDGTAWTTPGRYQSFAPIKDNNTDVIFSITQTFCQLLSFSILDPEDRATPCLDTPRCMPGAEGCLYKKLPDSLCPENDGDRANWRCHLGAKGNVNMEADYPTDEELNCTMEAPSGTLDPDVDPAVSKGQCCDPLGTTESGLPACNAFRIVSGFAAAAAEITTEPSNELRPICP